MKKLLIMFAVVMTVLFCLPAFAEPAASVLVNGITLEDGQYLQNDAVHEGEPTGGYPVYYKNGVLTLNNVWFYRELGADETAVIYADGDLDILVTRASTIYYQSASSSAQEHAAIYVTGDLKLTLESDLDPRYNGQMLTNGVYPKNAYGIYAGGDMEITGGYSLEPYASPINANGTLAAGIYAGGTLHIHDMPGSRGNVRSVAGWGKTSIGIQAENILIEDCYGVCGADSGSYRGYTEYGAGIRAGSDGKGSIVVNGEDNYVYGSGGNGPSDTQKNGSSTGMAFGSLVVNGGEVIGYSGIYADTLIGLGGSSTSTITVNGGKLTGDVFVGASLVQNGGEVELNDTPYATQANVTVNGGVFTAVGKTQALTKAPDYSGCPNPTVTACTDTAGSTQAEYDPSNLSAYKYIKIESGAPAVYRITVKNGMASIDGTVVTEAEHGTILTITADNREDEGLRFTGWESPNLDIPELYRTMETFTFTIKAGDVDLIANYEWIPYMITYDLDGGSLPQGRANPTTYSAGSSAITLVNPVREGYAFTGWTGTGLSEPTMTVVIKPGSVGERSYKATWKAAKYTITFADTGDSVIDPITAEYGAAIIAPADPVKTGYTFAGWDMPIPETMTAEDLTITAQWTVNQYTITFADTGDTVIDPITADYGTPIMPPANPMKAGFRFAGWDKPIPVTMPAQDMTITAQWTVALYTITFADTGDSAIEPITGEYGMTITPPADPVKTGHTFIGWDSAIPSVMPAQDLTITALWSVNSYTITFADTGDTVIDSITADYGTPITPPAAPVLFGHTFMGWHPAIPAAMPAQDLTVTAEWMLNQYTITFDTDGGSEVEPITLKFGEKVTAPKAPRKDHHAFVCWEPELPETMPAENRTVKAVWKPYPNGGMFGIYSVIYYQQLLDGIYVEAETEIQFPLHGAVGEVVTAEPKVYEGFTLNTDKSVTSAELKPAETAPDGTTVMTELKLYYDRNSYTLTYENMGDSAPAPLTLKYGEPIEAPDAPVKAGSVFKGWTQAIPETMPAENLTIGAVWEAKSGLETKTEVRPQFSAADITQALKDAGYATVQAIETELKVRLERVMSDLLNTQLYDAVLLFSEDGGTAWLKADREHFPASGKLQVLIPVPENTDPITHEYRVAHMFASDAFGKTPGDVETPAVSVVYDEEGRAMLSFEVTGLSPVMVSWRAKGTPEALPQTGDHSHLAAYAFLMALAMLGLVRMRRSARKNG